MSSSVAQWLARRTHDPAVTVDGGFGDWTDWTECSVTCGGGVRSRQRFCNNPAPQYGGAQCTPNIYVEEQMCNTGACSPNGYAHGVAHGGTCAGQRGLFDCKNGIQCVSILEKCDCMPHCADASDEDVEYAGCLIGMEECLNSADNDDADDDDGDVDEDDDDDKMTMMMTTTTMLMTTTMGMMYMMLMMMIIMKSITMIEQSYYRVLLQDLHSELLDEDVKCMKFLAQPLIQKRLYQNIQDGLGLFGALEDCGMLSNTNLSYLSELFEVVGRIDLQARISEECEVSSDAVSGSEPLVCPFRRLLYKLHREIPDTDLSRMRYLHGNVPKRETVTDPLDLFGFMIRERSLTPENLNTLKNILSEVSRQDLVEEISHFEVTVRPNECNYLFKKGTGPSFQEASVERNTFSSSSSKDSNSHPEYGMSYQDSDQQMPGRVFQQESVESENNTSLVTGLSSYTYAGQGIEDLKAAHFGGDAAATGMDSIAAAAPPSLAPFLTEARLQSAAPGAMGNVCMNPAPRFNGSSLDRYKMDAEPRGLCVIMDVQSFTETRLKFRAGSEYDRSSLRSCFERLKFHVEEMVNPSASNLYAYLKDISEMDHTAYDCLVICILSHGGSKYFYGSDCREVYEDTVFDLFSAKACPTLASKPKLFFFSYCRGQEGVPLIGTDGPSVAIDTDGSSVADLSDFLYGYATPQNYVSYRHKSKGSFYIQVLTQVLNEEAESLELQHILLRVNREVSNMPTGTAFRQMPEPKHTLQKQLYFL
ncbi:caspase-8 [Elysia marginata]|uniref:Caspase-8 n=1 Tax=Elysia marginata TaxID=1093978 RepID=A0AAV4F3N0_9GAST|nr:caspase-8 [Elysia marginata]